MRRKSSTTSETVCAKQLAGRFLGLLLLATVVGCVGGGTIVAAGSEDQVKQAVTLTLDAWKSGSTINDFTKAHPELAIADEEWQAGASLVAYKLMEPAQANGSHWRQKVELQTKVKTKSKPTVVYYAVTLGEKTSILRSDFQY